MTARRSFLALVGGGLFSGAVVSAAAAVRRPTLILPAAAPKPNAWPLLSAHKSQMHAILEIGQHVTGDAFRDWLEGGLQLAEQHRRSPQDLAREEARIEAAVARHGSIIGAMRAGAL